MCGTRVLTQYCKQLVFEGPRYAASEPQENNSDWGTKLGLVCVGVCRARGANTTPMLNDWYGQTNLRESKRRKLPFGHKSTATRAINSERRSRCKTWQRTLRDEFKSPSKNEPSKNKPLGNL